MIPAKAWLFVFGDHPLELHHQLIFGRSRSSPGRKRLAPLKPSASITQSSGTL
jgi:hypothetical protein